MGYPGRTSPGADTTILARGAAEAAEAAMDMSTSMASAAVTAASARTRSGMPVGHAWFHRRNTGQVPPRTHPRIGGEAAASPLPLRGRATGPGGTQEAIVLVVT